MRVVTAYILGIMPLMNSSYDSQSMLDKIFLDELGNYLNNLADRKLVRQGADKFFCGSGIIPFLGSVDFVTQRLRIDVFLRSGSGKKNSVEQNIAAVFIAVLVKIAIVEFFSEYVACSASNRAAFSTAYILDLKVKISYNSTPTFLLLSTYALALFSGFCCIRS